MPRRALSIFAASMIGALTSCSVARAGSLPTTPPLNADTITQINRFYRQLIEAENRHDLAAVRSMVWDSPSTLFVAKTATAAEGTWAGFWGVDVVMQHFADLYSGTFVMAPDYGRVKTMGLTKNVAVTYAPLNITVSYAGQAAVPKPFLMIVNWVRTEGGWKMATDIALPIPQANALCGRAGRPPRLHAQLRKKYALPAHMQGAARIRLQNANAWRTIGHQPGRQRHDTSEGQEQD